ncbi:MAG: T9SS type A sorting domain-containing protein [Ignavibacteriae bacterium]|nr:T9SS type A sorting domain-containing protein [Ignavibacteriota bacterium]MCB0711772.1 T9SS type A sorting domain-containing protein [Ignavibacteriota bacterium]
MFEAGRYAVEFDGSTLKPGTYLVELKTLNGRVTEKIIVQR